MGMLILHTITIFGESSDKVVEQMQPDKDFLNKKNAQGALKSVSNPKIKEICYMPMGL